MVEPSRSVLRTIPRPNLFLERDNGSGARVDVVLALLVRRT